MRWGGFPKRSGEKVSRRDRRDRENEEARRLSDSGGSGGSRQEVGWNGEEIEEEFILWDEAAGHDHDGTPDGGRQVSHTNLTDIGPDDHHAQQHDLTGSDHTASGLTAGQVLAATAAAAFGWVSAAGDVAGAITSLVVQKLRGKNVPEPGATEDGKFLQYDHPSGACQWAEAAGVTSHNDLADVTPNQHHNQQHSLTGSDHTVSGTEGHLLVVQAGGASVALEAPGTHLVRAGTNAERVTATPLPAGTLWYETDTQKVLRSTGASWTQIAPDFAHTHTFGGDVNGNVAATVVARIRGVTVATPASGDDGQFLRYNSASGGSLSWETPSGGGGSSGGQLHIPLHTYNGDVVWTNMPAAITELFSTSGNRYWQRVDLTGYTEARMTAYIPTAGAVGASLRAQYSTDGGGSWNYLNGGTGPEIFLNPIAANGWEASAWGTLPSGAKADVMVRVVGINGDGAADPMFGPISLQFR